MDQQLADAERLLRDVARLGWALLRRFSTTYAPADVISAVTGLSREEFEHLRSLHYLKRAEVEAFVCRSVPAFLRAMPMASELAIREDRSYPRGRTDWMRTATARMRQGGDASLFISHSPQRTRDTQAARLFAFLLNDIATAATRALDSHVPEAARAKIGALRTEALGHLAALQSRGVKRPPSAKPSDFFRLRRTNRSEVVQALALLERRSSLFGENGEERLREIMAEGLFAPENQDDLFEAWTLLQFVELHLNTGWTLESARIVGGMRKSRPHFTLRRGTESVEIYYQMVPACLAGSSAYKDLFADYDLDVSLRRPDITAHVRAETYDGPLIIEVKRSRDRTYIADAAYKVLGYLGDYAAHFEISCPKALLVVMGGIEPPLHYRSDCDVWIVPEARFRELQLPY